MNLFCVCYGLEESSDRPVLPTDVVECIQAVVGELLEQKLVGCSYWCSCSYSGSVGTGAAVGGPSTSSSVAVYRNCREPHWRWIVYVSVGLSQQCDI